MERKTNGWYDGLKRRVKSNRCRAGVAFILQGVPFMVLYYGAVGAAVAQNASGSGAAQESVCKTPIGNFTNGLITAALGIGLALVFLGLIVSFGGRPLAFSGSIMGKLSAMSSNSIVGLVGIVFVAVIFSWVLGYAPIDIPKGCVPLGG